MIPYQKQKIENAICFFASEYKKRTNHYLYSTYIYKFLAFLDFECIKENGRPSLGLTYIAMKRGPVPREIYNERKYLNCDCFEFKLESKDKVNGKEIERFIVVPKGEPNLDYFSDFEIDEMYRLIEIYADNFVKTSDISEASHETILSWKRAFRNKPNSIMEYTDEFPGNIKSKTYEKLSLQEENLLSYISNT